MTRRKLFGLGLTLGIAALVAGILVVRSQPRDTELDVVEALPEMLWQSDAAQRYAMSMESAVQLDVLPELGPLSLSQTVSGILNLRVFSVTREEIRTGFQLEGVEYQVNGMSIPEREHGLGAPFVAVFEPDGRIRAFEFPKGIGEEERTILTEMLQAFKLVFPDRSDTSAAQVDRSWNADETHNIGDYVAHYRADDAGRITKEKLRYATVNPSFGAIGMSGAVGSGAGRGAPDLSAEPQESSLAVHFEPGRSWIGRAEVVERLLIRAGDRVVCDSALKAEMVLVDGTPASDLALMQGSSWSNMLAQAEADRVGIAPEPSESERATLSEQRRQRFEQLLADLNGGKARDAGVLQDIIQLLIDEPGFALQVREMLDAPDLNASAEPRLIHALGKAGTKEAQQVLVGMTEDVSVAQFNKVRAIVALGGAGTVNEASVEALIELTQLPDYSDGAYGIPDTALLALGSIGDSLRKNEARRSQDVSEHLADRLEYARNNGEIEIALKAIGNSQDAGLAETVLPLIDHRSPTVRASAAETMGRLQAEGSLDVLTRQFETETDPSVRASLAVGMYHSGDTSVDSLEMISAQVANEPSGRARYYMARYLGKSLDLRPGSIETLRHLARTDQSSRVRRYASGVVEQGRTD